MRFLWHGDNGKKIVYFAIMIHLIRTLMFVQLWNFFLEKLKTTKQKIIYADVTEDLFMKKKMI